MHIDSQRSRARVQLHRQVQTAHLLALHFPHNRLHFNMNVYSDYTGKDGCSEQELVSYTAYSTDTCFGYISGNSSTLFTANVTASMYFVLFAPVVTLQITNFNSRQIRFRRRSFTTIRNASAPPSQPIRATTRSPLPMHAMQCRPRATRWRTMLLRSPST